MRNVTIRHRRGALPSILTNGPSNTGPTITGQIPSEFLILAATFGSGLQTAGVKVTRSTKYLKLVVFGHFAAAAE